MRIAALPRVERLERCVSDGRLLRSELCVGRFFVGVVFVAELGDPVSRADRQIHALAVPVPVCELPVQVLRIGWILVAEPVPALPDPVQVAVMEVEDRVTADGGEVGHVAPERDVSEEMRVLVQPGVEAEVAGGRIDVELLVQAIQTEPALPEYIERFAPIYPEPAGGVVERGA